MLKIGELSDLAGTSDKTIRYYEEIGLLPQPQRAANGYRLYDDRAVERLRFIRQARVLDFALNDIAEILAFRERSEVPCGYVMNLIDRRIAEIEARIRDLEQMREELKVLQKAGHDLPEDVLMRACVCHLIQEGVGNNEQETS